MQGNKEGTKLSSNSEMAVSPLMQNQKKSTLRRVMSANHCVSVNIVVDGCTTHVSCARPHLMSLTMLILGAKNDSALLWSGPQCFARASRATTAPIALMREAFHVDASDIGHGNTVALVGARA